MSDPFVAEIRIFPFNFPPRGWAFCSGQLLPISQNTALFSLLGTTYGGDGKSTFALPDLQGAVPLHVGAAQPGPGLSLFDLGEQGGVDFVTLLSSEMPVHTHRLNASADSGLASVQRPTDAVDVWSQPFNGNLYSTAAPATAMSSSMVGVAGGSQPHTNLQPYLTVNFCIAMQGIFPPR